MNATKFLAPAIAMASLAGAIGMAHAQSSTTVTTPSATVTTPSSTVTTTPPAASTSGITVTPGTTSITGNDNTSAVTGTARTPANDINPSMAADGNAEQARASTRARTGGERPARADRN